MKQIQNQQDTSEPETKHGHRIEEIGTEVHRIHRHGDQDESYEIEDLMGERNKTNNQFDLMG